MSFEIIAANGTDAYEKLKQWGNPPSCTRDPYVYTRYFGGDEGKPFCTRTVAGYWDATHAASETALSAAKLKGRVSVICLGIGSLMYHGYKGIKHREVDRSTTSGLRHDDGTEETCADEDTMKCYHQVSFPWIESGFPFEDKPFFFGPKTTADIYGANKSNTVVVAHKVPSARIRGNTSVTDTEKIVPLYQIPLPGGTTVTFRLTRNVNLINLSSLDNANRFISWAKGIEAKQKVRQTWRMAVHSAYTQKNTGDQEDVSRLGAINKRLLNNFLERIDNLEFEYGENALISGHGVEFVLRDDTYTIVTGVDGSQSIKHVSYFTKDSELLRLVRLWLVHEKLLDEIDGWFWGGENWSACSKGSLMSQEFCFFEPKRLLEYVTHTPHQTFTLPGVPTYDEFWGRSTTVENIKKMSPENIFYYPPPMPIW